MLKRRDFARAASLLNGIATLEKAYADRIIPVDADVVEEWTRMLGAKNKNRWDLALAATARVHALVLVTRNTKDFVGRGERLLNPFQDPPLRIIPWAMRAHPFTRPKSSRRMSFWRAQSTHMRSSTRDALKFLGVVVTVFSGPDARTNLPQE
ncbi:PilT protein [Mesorhizobium alhagi CCNWXJ12-2]|uniref:PilT protein n=1 Tax=Mesorhizobium alhagi CCNWXJ12-2 TaxID=1107882 RepID=H0HX54_9HYPH|nr:PilT protein [Mesorhizobium alhagi CCNWXJ12-2]